MLATGQDRAVVAVVLVVCDVTDDCEVVWVPLVAEVVSDVLGLDEVVVDRPGTVEVAVLRRTPKARS